MYMISNPNKAMREMKLVKLVKQVFTPVALIPNDLKFIQIIYTAYEDRYQTTVDNK